MYQLYVATRFYSHDGVHSTTILFQDKETADAAFDNLNEASSGVAFNIKVVKLYKD